MKGVLPAYAGMILRFHLVQGLNIRAPRVCGDDPHLDTGVTDTGTCSPRMRG